MAEANSKTKKRQLKKPETVRERASKAQEPAKTRRLRQARSQAARPVLVVFRFLGKLLRPFRFLLRPFKTKPLRFIGRILSKVLLLDYFRGSWQELKQVTWPGRKQTWQLTLAVFTFALFFGVIVAITDYGLDKLFKKLILN